MNIKAIFASNSILVIMKKLLFLLLLLPFFAQAQLSYFKTQSGGVLFGSKYKTVEGSPYLFEEYARGYVTDQSGKNHEGYLMYDAYSDELEFYSETQSKLILNAKQYPSFTVYEYGENGTVVQEIKYISGFEGDKFKPITYLRSLYDGKTKLLVWQKVQLHEPTSSYGQATTVSKFTAKENEFLVLDNGQVLDFSRRANWFKKNLSDKGNKAKKFITDEKLDLKTDADLLKLLTYLDTL